MKLISMTDFVLECYENFKSPTLFEETVHNYAKFLKQPLTLGMFVPCVDEEIFNYSKHGNKKEFEEASKKVIFHGFNVIERTTYSIVQIEDKPIWLTWNKNKTIEEVLVPLGVNCAVSF